MFLCVCMRACFIVYLVASKYTILHVDVIKSIWNWTLPFAFYSTISLLLHCRHHHLDLSVFHSLRADCSLALFFHALLAYIDDELYTMLFHARGCARARARCC